MVGLLVWVGGTTRAEKSVCCAHEYMEMSLSDKIEIIMLGMIL